jgi:hypothetical protein
VLLETLVAFSDVNHSFERADARLTVTWRYDSTFIRNSVLTSFNRDITPFFAMPRNICGAGMLHDLSNVNSLGHNILLGLTVSQARFNPMHDKHVRSLHEPCQRISDHIHVHNMRDEFDNEDITDADEPELGPLEGYQRELASLKERNRRRLAARNLSTAAANKIVPAASDSPAAIHVF